MTKIDKRKVTVQLVDSGQINLRVIAASIAHQIKKGDIKL